MFICVSLPRRIKRCWIGGSFDTICHTSVPSLGRWKKNPFFYVLLPTFFFTHKGLILFSQNKKIFRIPHGPSHSTFLSWLIILKIYDMHCLILSGEKIPIMINSHYELCSFYILLTQLSLIFNVSKITALEFEWGVKKFGCRCVHNIFKSGRGRTWSSLLFWLSRTAFEILLHSILILLHSNFNSLTQHWDSVARHFDSLTQHF